MILSLPPDPLQVSDLERIAGLLQRDGVIAYPTDTLYGLGCLISRRKAVDRIRTLKGRDADKPMSILCADLAMLRRYTQPLDAPTLRLLEQMFPGPYTAVLPCSDAVPGHLQNQRTVGLRIPDHGFCRAITRLVDEPIITTSCNAAGEPPLATSQAIEAALGPSLDLIVACGEPAGLASTIVDLCGAEPRLLRMGAGPWPL